MEQAERQWWLLYSIIVAGKSARFAENALGKWTDANIHNKEEPFNVIENLLKDGELENSFRIARTGNYRKLVKACKDVLRDKPNLKTCSPGELLGICGVGPKTARFFIIWTRPDEEYAVLDVHVLRWLKEQGIPNVPRSTPNRKEYARLEKEVLRIAKERGMTASALDQEVWSSRARY